MKCEKEAPPPVAVTVGEAARRLAVSTMTVRRLLERGALARVRVGRSVRVLASSVDDLAARGGEGVRDAK